MILNLFPSREKTPHKILKDIKECLIRKIYHVQGFRHSRVKTTNFPYNESNCIQNPSWVFPETWQANSEVSMKAQRIKNFEVLQRQI